MFAVGKIWMCWYILCNYLNLICDGLASSIIVILNYAIKCIQNPIITWYILRSSANLRSGIQLVGHSIGQLWNQAAAALSLCRPTTNWHFLPAIFYVSVPNRNKSLSLHSGKSEPSFNRSNPKNWHATKNNEWMLFYFSAALWLGVTCRWKGAAED